MRPFGVRQKLVLVSLVVLVVVSFGFTALILGLTRGWIEEDLQERAVAFAREVAATIGDRRELESSELLGEQVRAILQIRRNVSQLDIFVFAGDGGATVVATSQPGRRLPFTRGDVERTRQGQVVSRLIADDPERYWEVMAPVTLGGEHVGAVAAKFSLERPDRLAARTRTWAFGLTAVSVVLMALLMTVAIRQVVDQPLRRLLDAIARIRAGDTAAVVEVRGVDEFGVVARHFNDMMARITQFNDELQRRVKEAVAELDQRYQEVQALNETLYVMQRNLSHAERLAVSGRIVAEVAHEVGTPLHSVAGHLELLRRQLPPAVLGEEVTRRLAIIETQLSRVTEIITQLLDLTRRSAGPRGLVDLGRLARETGELVRPGASAASLTLQVEAEAGLPPVLGFAGELQQVILNLLTNAMDASSPGGRIHMCARAGRDRREAVLEVHDTGPGIAPGQERQIFEPFYTTKDPGRGTGLGLFISARIVRDHQGRIEVDSRPGEGSTFRVVLPGQREKPGEP